MSLKEARVAAANIQAQIRSGIDPNAENKSTKKLTMLKVLEDHILERSLAEWGIEWGIGVEPIFEVSINSVRPLILMLRLPIPLLERAAE